MSFAYHDNHCDFICVTSLLFLDVSHSLCRLGFSSHSSSKTPGEGCDVCVPMEPSSPRSHTLSMLTFWESVLITIYCKEELLWWGLRDALIYVYSSKSLGVVLTLCPFSRAIVLDSSLGPSSFRFFLWPTQPQILGAFNSARYGFHLMAQTLDPIRNWLAHPMTFMPLFVQ